jgi:hypothetical protein
MKSAGKSAPQKPRYMPPAIDPEQIPQLLEHALAGDVVQLGSLEELCAVLAEAQRRGYELKHRTEWEQRADPWLLILVPVQATGTAA